VSSNNRNRIRLWVIDAEGMCGERRCPNDVQSRNAKDFAWVEHAVLLEHFAGNRQRAVDRVRDDADVCLGTESGDALQEVADDVCVGLEEICGFRYQVLVGT